MNMFVLSVIIFFSFLSGFIAVFLVLGMSFKKTDDCLETKYYPIRPGLFPKKESVKAKLKEEYSITESDKTNQYEECDKSSQDTVSYQDTEIIAQDDNPDFLHSRIPSKNLSYTEFMSNLKEETSFEESLKTNLTKENDAYKILKRKKDIQNEDIVTTENKEND